MDSPRLWAFFGLLVLAVSLALWKGDKPERLGALIILQMTLLQFASLAFKPRVYSDIDLASAVIDLLGLVGFGVLATYAKRVWPIWAASLQLLSLISHFVRQADREAEPMVYVAMKSGPTFLALLALLIGTLMHIRRSKRTSPGSPWKRW